MSALRQSPFEVLRELLSGPRVAQAVSVAARLGIADLLEDGPQTPAQLSVVADCNADALRRMLRVLAGVGVFEEDAAGSFCLTPLAGPLRSNAPDSIRAYAVMTGERWIWGSLGAMEHTVRTGRPAFEHVFGMPLFAYYAKNPDAGRISSEGLRSVSRDEDKTVAAAYDFSSATQIIDLGGGQGGLLAAILNANARSHGVLFDLPHVMDAARRQFAAAGLESRVRLEIGNFFECVPAGADIYLMRKVLHDWDDEKCLAILKTCRAAMTPGSRLLIIEAVVLTGNTLSHAKLLDLLMLVYTGGRERTVEEYRTLLTAAGLSLERELRTASELVILEARAI